MEIWLHSSKVSPIQKAAELGVLHGVTTNLSLVAQSEMALEDLLKGILDYQKGPAAVQVVSLSAKEMIQQGLDLANFSNRIIVKVPVTREGLQAIHSLSSKNIPVMATAIFDSSQAFLAARAGASYIVPYFSDINKAEENGILILKEMVEILRRYRFPSKILASSLSSTEQVRECCLLGFDAVTMNEKLFDEYLGDHPLTLKAVQRFSRDWKKAPPRKAFSF